MTAKCYRCKEERPVEAFYRDKSKADGRKSICKRCDIEKAKRYYAEHLPEPHPDPLRRRRGRVREQVERARQE
jgi:hypothetical protein